ncbi:MAG: hypothetical protein JNK61_02710 [Bacteroidia bacterium]|nr:hypothetical protein [Bacteroidia bacterium]HQU99601.1 hypothetical protein [Bacteroidia bacterium]
MKNNFLKQFLNGGQQQYLFFFCIVLLSRIPFINAGYGAEEDSWGMMNAMQRMALTGRFEISRFPGHPIPEFIFGLMPFTPYYVINICTAFLSALAAVFFAAVLNQYKIKKAFWYAAALSFIPVIFIKSTDNMDYVWALAFIIMAWYFFLRQWLVLSAVLLALAFASRFTSIVFLPSVLMLLYFEHKKWKSVTTYALVFIVTVIICYSQIIIHYDSKVYVVPYILGFPDLLKTLYKSSIGVWGLLGCVAACGMIIQIAVGNCIINRQNKMVVWLALVLALLLFIWQPHKAAYLIVALPFLVFLWAVYGNGKYVTSITCLLIASNFLGGLYLKDAYRTKQPGSIELKIAGQPILFDVCKGPLLAEHEKRLQKIDFINTVLDTLPLLKQPAIILSGWYTNELEVLARRRHITLNCMYFMEPQLLEKNCAQHITVYFLPQQDAVNDIRWKVSNLTKNFSQPLFKSNTPFIF